MLFAQTKVDFRRYVSGIRIIAEHAKPLATELTLVLRPDADERERQERDEGIARRGGPRCLRRGRARRIAPSFALPGGRPLREVRGACRVVEGNRRIRRLDAEGLRLEVEKIVGTDIVNGVYRSTETLGRALGFDRVHETPSPTALQAELQHFSHAIGRYGRILASNADEEDATSMERFRAAVAPIDAYRSRVQRNGEPIDELESDTDAPGPIPDP